MIEAWLFYSLFTFFNTILPVNAQKVTEQSSAQNSCINENCIEPQISP